jgi:hypothetical protein
MKTGNKLPAAALLMTTPLAAYADTIPHIEALYAFGGGLAGGLIGSLLACWLCKRIRGSKSDNDQRK